MWKWRKVKFFDSSQLLQHPLWVMVLSLFHQINVYVLMRVVLFEINRMCMRVLWNRHEEENRNNIWFYVYICLCIHTQFRNVKKIFPKPRVWMATHANVNDGWWINFSFSSIDLERILSSNLSNTWLSLPNFLSDALSDDLLLQWLHQWIRFVNRDWHQLEIVFESQHRNQRINTILSSFADR